MTDIASVLADREHALVTSYADSVAHLDALLRIVTRIGGHMTSDDQRAVREARAFLKEAKP
jgi:hypothetical protein